MSVYVSIGRNVGAEPMSEARWNAFREDAADVVDQWAGPIVSDTVGAGWYEGTREDTAVIVGAGDAIPRARLAELARRYDQDAIAYAVAEPAFLGPVS